MIFNSLTFAVFFLAVFVAHRLPVPWTWRKLNLLAASYLFYAAWNPPLVLLLAGTTLVNWKIANAIPSAGPRGRRGLMVLSVCCNLGVLAFFKYAGFLVENFTLLMQALGVDYHPAKPGIILPVGVSFYTFEALSYTINIYRGKNRPWHSLLDFALFLGFFPRMVAGPILRPEQFLPQCNAPQRAGWSQIGWGLALLTIGLFEKAVLADGLLAPVVDSTFGNSAAVGSLDAWAGTMAFTGQIFFDFSGYSICAKGVALCLGFDLLDNFRFPYAARGFKDFWQRWHISLSSWLRDYLYISLGGNRCGAGRVYLNLMTTMLLGGLWHGASWTFVLWGGLHGLYLIGDRLYEKAAAGRAVCATLPARVAGMLVTFLLVSIAWVPFRAATFESAWQMLGAMFGAAAGPAMGAVRGADAAKVAAVMCGTILLQWRVRDQTMRSIAMGMPWWARVLILAAMIVALFVAPGEDRAFIYFQF